MCIGFVLECMRASHADARPIVLRGELLPSLAPDYAHVSLMTTREGQIAAQALLKMSVMMKQLLQLRVKNVSVIPTDVQAEAVHAIFVASIPACMRDAWTACETLLLDWLALESRVMIIALQLARQLGKTFISIAASAVVFTVVPSCVVLIIAPRKTIREKNLKSFIEHLNTLGFLRNVTIANHTQSLIVTRVGNDDERTAAAVVMVRRVSSSGAGRAGTAR